MQSRNSVLTMWAGGIVWAIAIVIGTGSVYPYVHRIGLPTGDRPNFWLLFALLEFLVVIVRQLGRALATWAVGYRLNAVTIGPLAARRDLAGGWKLQFKFADVPSGERSIEANRDARLRGNVMLILFAGPFATLNIAVALLILLVNLPRTTAAGWWEPVALGSILFTASFFRNLTPLGIFEGGRLLQLALRTPAGDDFLKLFVAPAASPSGAAVDEKRPSTMVGCD